MSKVVPFFTYVLDLSLLYLRWVPAPSGTVSLPARPQLQPQSSQPWTSSAGPPLPAAAHPASPRAGGPAHDPHGPVPKSRKGGGWRIRRSRLLGVAERWEQQVAQEVHPDISALRRERVG